MKNKNILLNLLLISFSITTLDLQSAARSSEIETKEAIELINSNEIIKAIEENQEEVAIKLIESHQFNLNFKDQFGQTALHLACKKSFYKVVKLLVKNCAHVNSIDKLGRTPLMLIGQNSSVDILSLLLEYGADANIKNHEGKTALMNAFDSNSASFIEQLLKHGSDVNIQDNFSWTALMLASLDEKTEIIELLLNHGADINHKSKNNSTALIIATKHCAPDIVKLLLKYDPDIEVRNESGCNALELAIKRKNGLIINLIKDHCIIKEYCSMIFKAYEQKNIKTCKSYLNKFKEKFREKQLLMLKNKEKNSLLHEAIIKRDYTFIDYLLNYNPEVIPDLLNMPNKHGMTPIDLAATDEYLLNYFMNFAYPAK